MPESWLAPNRVAVVEKIDRENPRLIYENDLEFCRLVICDCNKIPGEEGKWGFNGKRGNPNDKSRDVVTFLNSAVPWGCSIVDIIASHPLPSSSPAWIDQTHATYDKGEKGVFIKAECYSTPPVIPPTEPPITPEPPIVNPPVSNCCDELNRKLDIIMSSMETQFDFLVSHITSQSQATVDAVTAEANRIIASFPPPTKCRLSGILNVKDAVKDYSDDPNSGGE